MTPACLGDQLNLTCNTTGNLLKWSFYENGTSTRLHMLTIQSFGRSDQMHQFRINSISFTFIRISTGGSLPLMSNLTISPVTRGLNGTKINCEDQETGEISSTVISIILNGKLTTNNSCHVSAMQTTTVELEILAVWQIDEPTAKLKSTNI